MYCLFRVVLCIVCVYMCTKLQPPDGYPIAVKYIVSYHNILYHLSKVILYAFLIFSAHENATFILPFFIITKQYFVTTAIQRLVIMAYFYPIQSFLEFNYFLQLPAQNFHSLRLPTGYKVV
jgi:hypothetical protein